MVFLSESGVVLDCIDSLSLHSVLRLGVITATHGQVIEMLVLNSLSSNAGSGKAGRMHKYRCRCSIWPKIRWLRQYGLYACDMSTN